jgi:hypothetical protein
MSFREWLPVTERNRVALLLAFAAFLVFVTWNCLPYYEYGESEPNGIVAMTIWHEGVLDPDHYMMVLKDPDVEGFLGIAANMALIQCGLVSLAVVPFWKHLHGSAYIRLPLAVVNLLGGGVVLWFLAQAGSDDDMRGILATLSLIALNMFALSAAMLVFKNELALREERGRPQAG